MPFSSEDGKAEIKAALSRIPHDRMLDIGCGSGTYSKLFPESEWDGVEVWSPYIEKYNLRGLYKNLYVEDARTWEPSAIYDVAIAGDVLEHMTATEAVALVSKLKQCAKTVIISIPIGHYPQDEYEGNPYEAHIVDNWSDEAVKDYFGKPTWSKVTGEIGVYIYSSSIPNIIHFIWFTGPKSRDFGYINYLAIRAAHDVQKPTQIYLYNDEEPVGNPHWEAIRPYVEIVKIDAPDLIGDVPLEYPQQKADVVRLRKLYELGGIYLDTDMLLIKPLTPFSNEQIVLSAESYAENGDIKSINAGLIMATPKNSFISQWLLAMPRAIRKGEWAYQSVILPVDIYNQNSLYWPWVEILPAKTFMPFTFHDEWIFGDVSNEIRLADSYSVHMYDTFWQGIEYHEIRKIDNDYLKNTNNLFTHLFRKYMKKQLKICVYAISKNEELHVERFCEAAKPADMIFVADTGSTDNTVKLLKKHGAKVGHISISPWRFDDARNAALSQIPADIDVCVSLDLDEVLQEGWREEIEKVWTKGITRLEYKFDWGVGIVFFYQKIHARKGYRWHHPCHEYPVPDRIEEKYARTEKLMVIHKPDNTKSRGQYLDLLRVSIEEDPMCPRNAFYYARELSFNGQHDEAINQAHRYLALPRANWPNERCYAMRVIGRCYQEKKDLDKALEWFRKATSEAPYTREPWSELAMTCYLTSRWAEGFGAAMTCLSITERALVYTVDPAVWGAQPHDLASVCAWNLGLKEAAIAQAKIALDFEPENERFINNLRLMMESK